MRAPCSFVLVLAFTSAFSQTPSQPTNPAPTDPFLTGIERFAEAAQSATEVNTGPVTPEVLRQRLDAGGKHVDVALIYTFSYARPDMYSRHDVDALRGRLATPDWQCSFGTKHLSPGEQKQRCTRQLNPEYFEAVWFDTAPRELTLIHSISRGKANDPSFE